jgi:hypothetical protein
MVRAAISILQVSQKFQNTPNADKISQNPEDAGLVPNPTLMNQLPHWTHYPKSSNSKIQRDKKIPVVLAKRSDASTTQNEELNSVPRCQ